MRVRMKLVVPLTMPMTRLMRSPASDSRSGRMRGMAAHTAASNSRSTPDLTAASNSSAPWVASSSLLAVTTGLPASRAVRIRRAGGLDAAHDLDHQVDVGVGDHAGGVVGEDAGGEGRPGGGG